ncbi:hypothetical protein C2845_PM11G23470 [Panicum miliaceum]|uniref:PDZ domain-containing protein n=1 Tax=Panicum miliaceum TaxID=4540 RepID=A0A3L6RVV8_PANMI|nr:hypothetical protein C2845_PM11G23470 [Panicum miliaceum]
MASSSSSEQEGAIRMWLGHDSSGSRPRRRRTQEENSGLELGVTGKTDCVEETQPDPSPPAARGRKGSRASESREGKRRRERRARRRRRKIATAEGSEAAVEKNTEDSSSEYSSPIHRPKPLLIEKTASSGDVVHIYNSDPVAGDAYHRDFQKYQKKLARLQELPTLKQCRNVLNIPDWHDIGKKNAVLDVAESVLRISSFHVFNWYKDGREISSCSGIIIEWVEVDKSAIVVTSTRIICTKVSLNDWEDNNAYAPNAKVTAHLLDGTTSELTLLCFSKHYDIAFFESCTGGALADFDQNVLGMVVDALPNIAFIPSFLIIRKIARPHLGLKLRTVEFLDISHLDQLSRNFKIRSSLIVGKVCSGSHAESKGIRVGDVIFSCQGEVVSTISQFEGILLDVCMKQFEEGNTLNSKVDVEMVSLNCASLVGE